MYLLVYSIILSLIYAYKFAFIVSFKYIILQFIVLLFLKYIMSHFTATNYPYIILYVLGSVIVIIVIFVIAAFFYCLCWFVYKLITKSKIDFYFQLFKMSSWVSTLSPYCNKCRKSFRDKEAREALIKGDKILICKSLFEII